MEEEKLRTLKEMDDYCVHWVNKHTLKAEAVKWVKEELSFPHGQRRQTRRWMKRFNLTEEDLK